MKKTLITLIIGIIILGAIFYTLGIGEVISLISQTNLYLFALAIIPFLPIEFALAHKGLVDWVYLDVHTQLPLTPETYPKLKEAGFKLCLTSPSLLGRPEDVAKYRQYMKENGIEIDAVVEDLEHVDKWLSD